MRGIVRTIRPLVWAGAISVLSLLAVPGTTAAFSMQEGVNAARGEGQPSDLFGSGGVLTTVTNTLLFVVGALSVIMIIIGGLRYIVSGGNTASVTAAKNTVLYAIVGLIIAFLAFAAVNFVMANLGAGSHAGYTDV